MKRFEIWIVDLKEGVVFVEGYDTILEAKTRICNFEKLKNTEHWSIIEYDDNNNVINEDIIYSNNIKRLLAC